MPGRTDPGPIAPNRSETVLNHLVPLQKHVTPRYYKGGPATIAFLPLLTKMRHVRSETGAMSTDSTLTSKGRTTIPKDIRETLGMKSGDRMTFTMLPDCTVLMRIKKKRVMSLAGRLRK
jgi:antitoxin PrlF